MHKTAKRVKELEERADKLEAEIAECRRIIAEIGEHYDKLYEKSRTIRNKGGSS